MNIDELKNILSAQADEQAKERKSLEDSFKAQQEELEQKILTKLDERKKNQENGTTKNKNSKIVVGDEPIDKDGKWGFPTFHDFVMSIYKSGKSGLMDKRLIDIDAKAAGTGLEIGNDSDAGFLIPPEHRTELLRNALEIADFPGRCRPILMERNSVRIPYINETDRSSGYTHGLIQMYWLAELGQRTESRPQFGHVELNLNKLTGMCYLSDELLDDSPTTMAPLISQLFSEALAWKKDNVILNGTGAGQPQGIINAPCTIEISKENNQGANTIIYQNILKMYQRMPSNLRNNAVWVANNDTFQKLSQMSLSVGTGGTAVMTPIGGATGQPWNTIFNRPVIFTEHAQTLGTSGDFIFVAFNQYLLGRKSGPKGNLQMAQSIHLKFDYDQVALKFTYRMDGQPWWQSPITPRYSSETISPVIKIATRS